MGKDYFEITLSIVSKIENRGNINQGYNIGV